MNDKLKKPKNIRRRPNGPYAECPTCGYKLLKTPFCSHCGQAIDWSENATSDILEQKLTGILEAERERIGGKPIDKGNSSPVLRP
jgi:DNA-directed RNA polymerase subunit RPC12/RpoP